MRHQVAQRKLGVKSAHRQALLANLASSLILSERIATTLPKAKELRPIADRIVTLAKKKSIHAMRRARQILRNRIAVKKAFDEFAERYADRHGGYTRILKLGFRHGDSAPMAMIEYLPSPKMLERQKAEEGKKPKKAEKTVKKGAVTLKEKFFGKAAAKTKAPAERHEGMKTPARKVPQQRAKKEA